MMRKPFLALGLAFVSICMGQYVEAVIQVGREPVALCHNPSAGKVYCASRLANTVAVIDQQHNLITAWVPVGTDPYGLFYNSRVDKVYCTSVGDDDVVTVISGSADTMIAAIDVPDRPRHLVRNALGDKVYCACFGSDYLAVIDAHGDSVLRLVDSVYQPDGLCYDSRTNRLYVSQWDSYEVVVVDAGPDTVLSRIWVGPHPRTLVLNERDDKLYCLVAGEPSLAVLDASADTLVSKIDLQTGGWNSPMTYIEDQGRLYLAEWGVNSRLTVFDGMTDSVVATFTDLNFPEGIAYVPATGHLFMTNNRDSTVTVLDAGSVSNPTTLVSGHAPSAALADTGRRTVYVANSLDSTLVVIRDAAGIAEEKPQAESWHLWPAVCRGVLRLTGNTKAVLLDITGRKVVTLQPGNNDIRQLAPGIYFLRSAESGKRNAVRKIVIQR